VSSPAGRLGRSGQLVDGRYRLGNLLGVGGFGEVWEAVQEVEGTSVRPLALKLLAAPTGAAHGTPVPGKGDGHEGHEELNWLNEVRAIREVRCPSITTIYDVGIARDPRVAFIAMELLRGETLEQRLRRQTIYWRRALAIARDMAAALRACHQVDVIHCDLKPVNVFLGEDGRICVLDFGVAALGAGQRAGGSAVSGADSGPSGDDSTGQVALSELPEASPSEPHHTILGTPGYIPPEGYERTAPSPAGDVFALGVVLYRMIAGRLPQRLRGSPIATAEMVSPCRAAISSVSSRRVASARARSQRTRRGATDCSGPPTRSSAASSTGWRGWRASHAIRRSTPSTGRTAPDASRTIAGNAFSCVATQPACVRAQSRARPSPPRSGIESRSTSCAAS